MIETFIYILYDKHDIPFYIGKSISVKNRLYVHKLKYGNDIQMEILDIVYDWKFWESFYISLYKSWGFILKNKNKGGGGLTYVFGCVPHHIFYICGQHHKNFRVLLLTS